MLGRSIVQSIRVMLISGRVTGQYGSRARRTCTDDRRDPMTLSLHRTPATLGSRPVQTDTGRTRARNLEARAQKKLTFPDMGPI